MRADINLQLLASRIRRENNELAYAGFIVSVGRDISCWDAQSEGTGDGGGSRVSTAASPSRAVDPPPLGRVERDLRLGRVRVLFVPARH